MINPCDKKRKINEINSVGLKMNNDYAAIGRDNAMINSRLNIMRSRT